MSEKAIFLDRDDTLIDDPGYISSPDQVKLLDGVPGALVELKAMGYKLVVVSNQSGIARGIVTEKALEAIHERLFALLAEKGAFLDKIYYCPYHPDGVIPKYRKESNDRKPNPGMLLTAAKEMDIDLSQSWSIGNSSRDVEAGRRAGCKTILIDGPSRKQQILNTAVLADYRGINLKEAVNIIKKHLRSASSPSPAPQPEIIKPPEPTAQSNISIIQEKEQAKISIEPEQKSVQQGLEEEPAKQATNPSEQIRVESQISETARNVSQEQPVNIQTEKSDKLLVDILGQLKSMQRANMFNEFSLARLIAGIVQILVLFCLLIVIWFLLSPQKQSTSNSIFIALGFAAVFQLMSLSFYIMHGRK
jgi:D-glycero-D-manno-heptose 1,7-bisphosphate phosphatase